MRGTHEPREEFVEKLEWQIGLEARRRNRAAEAPGWIGWSRSKTTFVVLTLMLVSMGIGAAAVAAAYQVQDSDRRDQLTTSVEQRLSLAQQRLAAATSALQDIERQVAVGLSGNTDVLGGRIKVAEAEAQLRTTQLQLEEIRLTGRDPRSEMSAPRVKNRDFVGDRLRIELSVPEATLALEQARLQEAQKRVAVGVVDAAEVDAVKVRVLELEAALQTMRTKVDVRQRFLAGSLDAVEAELRVLEAEAVQRKATLAPQLDLARKEVERVTAKVQVGVAPGVDLTTANLRRLQLETDLLKADLDLTLVRRQIAQHRQGKDPKTL